MSSGKARAHQLWGKNKDELLLQLEAPNNPPHPDNHSQRPSVTIRERTFKADTMKRTLDFMYHGGYDVCTTDTSTKLDVLTHLFATPSVEAIWQKI